MRKYALVINEETKECNVGIGSDIDFYKSIGMSEQEVEQAYNNRWYLLGYAPEKPAPTEEEQRENRARAYKEEVDHLMAEYNRKKTFNLFEEGEEEALLIEVEAKVEEIKQRYPYPEEENDQTPVA